MNNGKDYSVLHKPKQNHPRVKVQPCTADGNNTIFLKHPGANVAYIIAWGYKPMVNEQEDLSVIFSTNMKAL